MTKLQLLIAAEIEFVRLFALLSVVIKIPKIAHVVEKRRLQARSGLGDDELVSGQVFQAAA